MTTATIPSPPAASLGTPARVDRFAAQRFVMYNVPWSGYEAILGALDGRRGVFVTYNRGTLELMSPASEHERISHLIARVIQVFTEVKRVPAIGFGTTTWRRESAARGLEADQCFYVQNVARVRGRNRIDLATDPPPDLAIEVDLSRAGKEEVYAGLGVPELWRYEDDGRITVLVLGPDGRYTAVPASVALPGLPLAGVADFIERAEGMDDTEFAIAVRAWATGLP